MQNKKFGRLHNKARTSNLDDKKTDLKNSDKKFTKLRSSKKSHRKTYSKADSKGSQKLIIQ